MFPVQQGADHFEGIIPTQFLRVALPNSILAFQIALLCGLGGCLYLLRSGADPYTPLPQNLLTLGMTSLAWIAVLGTYALYVLSIKNKLGLCDTGALLIVIGFLELVLGGAATRTVFSYIPRSHIVEDEVTIRHYITEERLKFPTKIDDSTTLTNISYQTGLVIFEYTIKSKDEHTTWSEDGIRETLKTTTCSNMKAFFQLASVWSIGYIVNMEGYGTHNFIFDRSDCEPQTVQQQ